MYTATSKTHELRKVWRQTDGGPRQDEAAEGYRYAKEFFYKRHEINSLGEACNLLNELSDAQRTSLVLGRPLSSHGTRTSLDFSDEKTRWFVIDLDSLDYDGPAADAVRWAIPFLNGRQFVYAYSPSSGFKSGQRLRVIFEVEPMHLDMMQVHAEEMNTQVAFKIGTNRKWIDYSIYKLGGLVFTARPKLHNLEDPHPIRAHLVDGIIGPVRLPDMPEMVDIEAGAATRVGDQVSLHWIESARHNSVFNFMVGYRTANKNATWSECWNSLNSEYARLTISASDRRQFGEQYVKSRFNGVRGARLSRKAFKTNFDPIPLAEAERRLTETLRDAIGERDTPKLTCIRVDAGGGKSTGALRQLGVEKRYAENIGMCFAADYYVPHHRLSGELVVRAQEEGLDAFIELGRGQMVGERRVCEKHEAASKLQGVVKELAKTLCQNEDAVCSYRTGCIWWEQKDQSLTADLRIRSHNFLSIQPPGEHHGVRRRVDVNVIDEDATSSFLHKGYVEVKELCDITRHEMGEWQMKLAKVIKDGISIARLSDAGITEDICRKMIKVEQGGQSEVNIHPGMSKTASLDAASRYISDWWRYASFWRRLRDCISSGSLNRIRVSHDKKAVITNWADVVKAIPVDDDGQVKVTTVIMSATMRRSMIEQFFVIDKWVDISIEKHPQAQIIQADLGGSKASVLYGTGDRVEEYGEDDPKKVAAAKQLRSEVAAISETIPLLSYKGMADLIPVAGWFNALEGLNHWEGQDVAVFGRPLPAPRDVEDMARAIHQNDAPILAIPEWYPKRPIARVGPGMAWCERHPDERVEDIRWTLCEGAIMQAVARTRYVRQPCRVLLLSSTVLPLEVDAAVQFDELLPENVEYRDAPLRTTSPKLAQKLFSKFEGMSAFGIKQGVGDLFEWAMSREAEFIEVRCEGDRQWSRVWVAGSAGWAALEKAKVVDWRMPRKRRDDNEMRFDAMVDQTQYVSEVKALREAFEREAWVDDEGIVPTGRVMVNGMPVDIGQMAWIVRDETGADAGSLW